MPNWVSTSIRFNSHADLQRVLSVTKTDRSAFDFEALIPMPKALRVESGSRTDEAIVFFETERLTKEPEGNTELERLVRNPFFADWVGVVRERLAARSMTDEEADGLYALGRQYVENFRSYGHPTWYSWCLEHWGTKWGACGVSVDETAIWFDTAWSPAIPVFEHLIARFPDIPMRFSWSEEQFDLNTGAIAYDGNGTVAMVEPDADTYEAFVIAAAYWDPDQDNHRWDPDAKAILRFWEDEDDDEKAFKTLPVLDVDEELERLFARLLPTCEEVA